MALIPSVPPRPAVPPPPIPPWLTVAKHDQAAGVAEIVGKGSNPRIMQLASKLHGWARSFFTDDDIPWCAVAVQGWLGECGIEGTNSLAAASYRSWGMPIAEPVLGCVVTFVRPGGGHVGFYVGESADGSRIRVIGGNQKNSVREDWFTVERVTGYRWPLGVELPIHGRVILADDGAPISTNES